MRTLLAACLLLLLAAPELHAHTTHVRWNACFGDGGALNRSFACDTNSGSEQLACTFTLTGPVTGVVQIDGFVNLTFAGTSIPAWWQFLVTGSCRVTGMTISSAPPVSAVACVDWADGGRDALFTYKPLSFGPNIRQLETLSPSAPGSAFDLVAGQEYEAFTAIINHQKTVGTGACGGCDLGGCMGFVGLRLIRSTPASEVVVTPDELLDQVVTWQDGSGIAIPNFLGAGFTYCPGATPARSSTWGAVKALYR